MYALPNKTQHKLIVKVRGGISQKLDNFNSSSASSAATGNSSSNNSKIKNSQFSSSKTSFVDNSSSSFISKTTDPSSGLSRKDSTFNKLIEEYENDLNLPRPVFYSISSQHGTKQRSTRAHKQYITPEHNEMIRYVQQSWKGVERDYKKSVNNFINNIDLNGSSDCSHPSHLKQKNVNGKKKTATTSTPLLLTGSYHHTSSNTKDSSSGRQDSFQPFDLETFWGNRILKRLTQEL